MYNHGVFITFYQDMRQRLTQITGLDLDTKKDSAVENVLRHVIRSKYCLQITLNLNYTDFFNVLKST